LERWDRVVDINLNWKLTGNVYCQAGNIKETFSTTLTTEANMAVYKKFKVSVTIITPQTVAQVMLWNPA
jgi:hypothetical protein